MILKFNRLWETDEEALPHVIVNLFHDKHFLHVRFQVTEPEDCFIANVKSDGGHAWEDSCVEIFVQSLNSNDYLNFELTSRGYCYAARGRDRAHRTEVKTTDYTSLLRHVTAPIFENGFVSWELKVSIPAKLLGCSDLSQETLYGNIYKCADRARRPHYLTLFPINTEKPDFHQPRFFQKF